MANYGEQENWRQLICRRSQDFSLFGSLVFQILGRISGQDSRLHPHKLELTYEL